MSRARAILTAFAALGCVFAAAPRALAAQDLERARVLDQQGVRAYKDEHYNDAIRFFEEAFRLGGPPSELWNISKCYLRLDAPEDAAHEIQRYLHQPGLGADDRADAEQQLHEIEHRHSVVTVTSSPAGALVYLDGKRGGPAGATPATLDVPPGSHSVTVEGKGYDPYEQSFDAKYGRAVIVEASLSHGDTSLLAPSTGAAGAANDRGSKSEHPEPHRLTLQAELGAVFPRWGGVGGSASPGGLLSAAYVALDANRLVVTAGARVSLTSDSWSNTVGAPSTGASCGAPIPSDEGATAVSAFLDGGVAYRLSRRWRIGGDFGLGIATYSVDEVGGDLFTPTCRPSPGVKPALYLGGDVSYALSRELRLVFTPVSLQLQPAFNGARTEPKDASGLWLRYGIAAGLAFDAF